MTKRSVLRSRTGRSRILPALFACLTILSVAPPAQANEKYAAVVVDANSGQTLFASSADARRYPASLTKMMTLYVLFEELDAGRLSLTSPLSVSANAAAQPPSKIGVRAGSTIKVEDAIKALTTKSANDVAVVVAENVGGSVGGFASRMTRTARAIGMRSTRFRNPHGLPDSGQVTTARDMARLGIALQDRFPSYYKYFSTRNFTYRGARHRNHNRLLGSVDGVDGIKTGYTRASGFNLVSNVRRDGRHVVAVVMGGKTAASRDAHMRELIAKYVPEASRGSRTAPLLVAETGAEAIITQVRLPRPRPGAQAEGLLAYAGPQTTPDIVSAAMAGTAAPRVRQDRPSPASDPIAERIAAATEVAELAYATPQAQSSDPIARLTRMAQIRAGNGRVSSDAPIAAGASEASSGWQVQIGAVPTVEGARALIEKAQDSLGATLAARQPLTQPVERDGVTLYRARFAGFSGKEDARETCAKLESKSITCLAVPS